MKEILAVLVCVALIGLLAFFVIVPAMNRADEQKSIENQQAGIGELKEIADGLLRIEDSEKDVVCYVYGSRFNFSCVYIPQGEQ